jgi:cytochrome bd-type quinol oxidase subunit 1
MKKRLENRVHGWLPENCQASVPQGFQRRAKYPLAIGYGVGIGLTQCILWTAFLLGWYKEAGDFLAAQTIIIPLGVLAVVIGFIKRTTKRQTGFSSPRFHSVPYRG